MLDVMLRYHGGSAENNVIDLYDAARALAGFQRSLALTTHLVLNGEIITQAPALKNASILTSTPRPGSWEVVATIVGSAWAAGTASKDSPLGHLIYSVYDYVISQTLGFPVDYSKSLYQQYQSTLESKQITPAKLDSLTEKTENSISDMHRPIVASKSATMADLYGSAGTAGYKKLGPDLSYITYEFLAKNVVNDNQEYVDGSISSYNINTFSGRIFSFEEERPIPFELIDDARRTKDIDLIVTSLRSNAIERGDRKSSVRLTARRVESSTGRLKALKVFRVEAL